MLPDATDASAELDADATRRAFLKKVAIGGAAAAIGTQVLPLNRLVPGAGAQDAGGDEPAAPLGPDEARMTFLAGLSLAAAAIYHTASGDEARQGSGTEADADAATTTTLPPVTVPQLAEPVVEVLRTFGSHHAQQAVAINAAVTTAVTAPNATLVTEVRSALAGTADEGGVLDALRDLEERLAATHLDAIGALGDASDAKLVSSALPIVAQHAVVLGRIGGSDVAIEELVPEVQTTDRQLTTDAYPATDAGATDEAGASDESDSSADAESGN